MDYHNYNQNEYDSYGANDSQNQQNFPQQPPPPAASSSQYYPPNSPQRPIRKNDYLTKNYNDFMERQGIPALTSEDLEILRECGRESLYYRCNYFYYFPFSYPNYSLLQLLFIIWFKFLSDKINFKYILYE